MATYSASKRLIRAYDKTPHPYVGMGPAFCKPKRLRVLPRLTKRGRKVNAVGFVFGLWVIAADREKNK